MAFNKLLVSFCQSILIPRGTMVSLSAILRLCIHPQLLTEKWYFEGNTCLYKIGRQERYDSEEKCICLSFLFLSIVQARLFFVVEVKKQSPWTSDSSGLSSERKVTNCASIFVCFFENFIHDAWNTYCQYQNVHWFQWGRDFSAIIMLVLYSSV